MMVYGSLITLHATPTVDWGVVDLPAIHLMWIVVAHTILQHVLSASLHAVTLGTAAAESNTVYE